MDENGIEDIKKFKLKFMKKFFDSVYDNKMVLKPWGCEYVAYRNKKKLAITFLKIDYNKETSLHCHPNKKTGFILIDGNASIQLGLWKKTSKVFNAPDKLMIRTGLFHSIKALSKRGLKALEFETPVLKNDLVRYDDKYGRELKPYEGKNFIKKINTSEIFFDTTKNYQEFKVNKTKIILQKYKNFSLLLKKNNKNIFAVVDGSIIDQNKKKVLSIGDIIRTGTIKKLAEKFLINKTITLLEVYI